MESFAMCQTRSSRIRIRRLPRLGKTGVNNELIKTPEMGLPISLFAWIYLAVWMLVIWQAGAALSNKWLVRWSHQLSHIRPGTKCLPHIEQHWENGQKCFISETEFITLKHWRESPAFHFKFSGSHVLFFETNLIKWL